MIPDTLVEYYKQLFRTCRHLLESLNGPEVDGVVTHHQTLQAQFQAMLAAASPQERQHLQQYNTELHKEIQLLTPDISGWKIAKQPEKKEKRRDAIQTRGDRIQTYIQTLLTSDPES